MVTSSKSPFRQTLNCGSRPITARLQDGLRFSEQIANQKSAVFIEWRTGPRKLTPLIDHVRP